MVSIPSEVNTHTITAYNPVSGEAIGTVPISQPSEVSKMMDKARQAQPPWAALPLNTRLAVMKRARNLLFERQDELTNLIVNELGKVPHEARFEILQPLVGMDYQFKIAKGILKPKKIFISLLPHRKHRIYRQPHGVVLVISPWNFPVLLALDAIVPALLAGNAVIYKPSEHTPLIGEFLVKLFYDVGLPENLLQIVHGFAETASALIDQHPDKIHFTGSVATGRKIASKAGEMLIPLTLELGGKDAAIVLADADFERAARGIVWGGMVHGGQMCAGVERVFVMRPVADKLIGAMRDVVRNHVEAGMPSMDQATYGTITLEKQVQTIDEHIREAEECGARVFRDKPLAQETALVNGHYREPVIIADAPGDSKLVQEETFGPVIVVQTVDSVEEAIEKTNDSPYGLTASIWTRDKKLGEKIALQLQVGNVGINDHLLSSSAPHLPWGGVKDTGYGRTRGQEGLLSMTVTMGFSTDRFNLPIDLFWYPYTQLKKSLVRRLIYLWCGPSLKDRLKGLWRLPQF